MNEPNLKIAHFFRYCPTCAHYNCKMTEEPCNECLNHPGNVDSHKPVKYEEKPKKKTK